MVLHSIQAVTASNASGVYIADVVVTDADGVTETVKYTSMSNDPFGLAPQVWAAVQEWILSGKPVGAFNAS